MLTGSSSLKFCIFFLHVIALLILELQDEQTISPSELAVLDCLMNNGIALTLKVGFNSFQRQ